MKAFIKNYGCQMNEQDALHMRGLVARNGYGLCDDPHHADLVLLVTCSIREKAVHKVYSDLGRLRPVVEGNPNLVVGLAGCVAQQEKENLFKRFPFLDLVFGPDAIGELPNMLEKARLAKKENGLSRVLNTQFHQRKDFEFVNLIGEGEENRFRAFVNIQKGCDNVCSFCIVPRVRGPEVSRPSREILDEIRALTDMGVKEVTLLGQNVNSYGLKDSGEMPFASLLSKIASQTNLQRLRFTTSHPKDVGDDLVASFRDLPVLCPHFHLPVQSGSDRVLEAMRRQYTRKHYLNTVEALQKARPDLVFSTDVIVGFPGEEEKDFKETLSLLDEVGFDFSFSFAYSPRPGTSALRLPDTLDDETKKRRLEIFQEKQRVVAGRKNRAFVGKNEAVLVEEWDGLLQKGMGRTGTNKIVHFSSQKKGENILGEFVSVHIKQGRPHSLVGEVAHAGI